MKNTVRINHETRQLIMDRTFAKLSSNVRNEEYDILQRVRQDYPTYTVEVRRIKTNPNKESYKGLNLNYMRRYIDRTEPTEESREAAHKEMDDLLFISQCHSKARRFPAIRKWFLAKYPEIALFGMPDDIEENPNQEETKTSQAPATLPAHSINAMPEEQEKIA